MTTTRRLLAFLAFALIAASCGGSEEATFPDGAFAVRANRDITVGTERLLVGVRQADGGVLGTPDQVVEIEVQPTDDPSAAPQRVTAGFSWIVPDVTGLYRAVFEFDRPGVWQATVIPASGPPLEPAMFSVLDPACATNTTAEGVPLCAVQVGEQAPAIASPTLATNAIEDITTDPSPDERLYQLSLDEALANGRPTVVVFATPAFCTTAACGPLVDIVQGLIDDYPGVDFVHVEVFTGFRDPGFDPSDPARLAPSVAGYRLLSEPWVYVVDAAGIVSAKFEGVMDGEELEEALAG